MTAVVFDVGNVLIDWNAHLVWQDDFASPAEIDAFMAEIGFDAWNLEQDRGRPFAEGVAQLGARHPHRAALIAKYHTDWVRSVPTAHDGTVAILDALHRADVPVYAITNFSAETWPLAVARFPFLGTFRDTVVSGEERLVKPDAAIYRRLIERNGLDPASCIFIDDKPVNCDGARAVGMDAVHFTGPEALATALRDRGLPV